MGQNFQKLNLSAGPVALKFGRAFRALVTTLIVSLQQLNSFPLQLFLATHQLVLELANDDKCQYKSPLDRTLEYWMVKEQLCAIAFVNNKHAAPVISLKSFYCYT